MQKLGLNYIVIKNILSMFVRIFKTFEFDVYRPEFAIIFVYICF